MGKVTTHMSITNRGDQVLAERGIIQANEIRSVNVEDALVDTGATTLCVPPAMIRQLGLSLLKEVVVNTSAGLRPARIFQDAKVSLLGREGTFECLESPGGDAVLVGALPLEALGIEIDLQNQTLRLLPITTGKTFYTA